MKFSVKTGLVALATVMTMTAAGVSHAGKTLTWTDGSPNRGTRAEASMWFADQLEQRTNGDLKIEFHWGGALLKAKAAPKGIGAGAADMGLVLGVYNPKFHHGLTLGDLPTQYSDPWVSTRAMYELIQTNKDLQDEFDKLNLQFIANVTATEIQLICKGDPVRTLEDIKGKKVRGIGVYGKIFKDLGATPVSMTVYKSYQGLDTGLLDCSQIYTYAIPAFKLQEVASEVTLLDWGALLGLAYVMNKDTYEALPQEQKDIINQLGSDYVDHFAEKARQGNMDALAELEKAADGNKVNIHTLSPADKEKLLEASGPYLAEWQAEAEKLGMDGAAMHKQFLALLKKYEDERLSAGYPWTR
ncbi:C4-dicarboxylate TRAP transporter substrate-binding protein [Sneathiella chinensis]|uniref:C4-dicarboxylate ABC transporter substrate-binding protein n=1 Tax=Sneathiella chinensis TaxID=349750 RepID=A0ABQ5U3L6_9PROT|nr:C4-dicarboxylate TRAP transporter substrate-binding protein [Sneathiella chinensis]GLQ05081.1 hypothetical protein GCM10007924_03020 [Sneathiella chinensis]